MSKRTALEKQLADVVRAEEYLNGALVLLGNANNGMKAKLWDEVSTLVKQIAQERMNGVAWATIEKQFQIELTDRVLKVVLGPESRQHMEKF